VRSLLVFVFVALSACVPVEAVTHAERQATNAHALSLRAPTPDGRVIGGAQEVAWRTQYLLLTGDDVPQARLEGWLALPPLPADVAPAGSAR